MTMADDRPATAPEVRTVAHNSGFQTRYSFYKAEGINEIIQPDTASNNSHDADKENKKSDKSSSTTTGAVALTASNDDQHHHDLSNNDSSSDVSRCAVVEEILRTVSENDSQIDKLFINAVSTTTLKKTHAVAAAHTEVDAGNCNAGTLSDSLSTKKKESIITTNSTNNTESILLDDHGKQPINSLDVPSDNDQNHDIDDNRNNNSPTAQCGNIYEKAIRGAIYYIRARSQKRASYMKASSGAHNKGYGELDTSVLTSTIAEDDEIQDQQEDTDAMFQAREEEWKARRARMAHYASILSNDNGDELNVNGLVESNNTTTTTTTDNNNNIHNENENNNESLKDNLPENTLSLHPPSDPENAVLIATKLDDRLLSPPVDVRKTVAYSAAEMFRIQNSNTQHFSQGERNDEPERNIIQLANPVLSLTTPVRPDANNNSLHTERSNNINIKNPKSIVSSQSFYVAPMSPAPGKLDIEFLNNTLKSSTASGVDLVSVANSSCSIRKASLEMERKWRREEDIERGVEQVLMSILELASSDKLLEQDDLTRCVEKAFSSLNVESVPQVGGTHLKMRPMRVASTDEEDIEDSTKVELDDDMIAISNTQDKDTKSFETFATPISNLGTQDIEEELLIDEEDPNLVLQAPSVNDGIQPTLPVVSEGTNHLTQDDEEQDEIEALDNDDIDKSTASPAAYKLKNVLGPLSKQVGGTTGVVLHDDEDDFDDSSEDSGENESSILSHPESIKSESSYVEAIDGDHLNDSSPSIHYSKSIVSKGSQASSSVNLKGSKFRFDRDEVPLMREIYSHLLPNISDSSRKSISGWLTERIGGGYGKSTRRLCMWDDDPDEPGYITHTCTRYNLQRMESEFENLLKSSRLKIGEENLNDKSSVEPEDQKSPIESVISDDSNESPKSEVAEDFEVTETNIADENFPFAKASGCGKVGELEIYHLPIIYKAHQTGFEPTKDLVLQPDTLFAGKYYVKSELGSAAFSTTYRCIDLNSGKKGEDGETYYDEVCLKVIKNTKDFFDQSLDEIKILELLRQTGKCHEHNIVEMKTFFYHKEHLIIVTELLRQNLFEFGKYIIEHEEPRYFTRQRLCYIARQCLIALNFVHKLGLVHSDIKPENILLASYSRARVKVIDFGSSCYLTDRQSSYIQSRSYRAPEVVLGLPYDGRIDIWSLGCVVAEMYTGLVTFQNDSVVSMLSRIEAICGPFPKHMIERGRMSSHFFTPNGILYEKIESDDESEAHRAKSFIDDDESSTYEDSALFHVYQPKITTMAARLGFAPDLMEKRKQTWEDNEKAMFVDFVTKLLTIDPANRPTAAEALEHPWILSGFHLSEDDLIYPPEE